jgi:AAA+ ATPase superfamily predicted ATPase
MAFINREEELAFLEEKWRGSDPQLIVLWGKRRVGKTELVRRFITDRPHIYFLAESTNEKEQLNRFSRTVGEFFTEPLLTTRGFSSWEEGLRYISEKKQRLALAIDEFPYLIVSNKGISSVFQRAWDEYLSRASIYLVLLGSSTGMMETEVLGHKAPLYGRRTGQWKVRPLPFAQASRFRERRSFEDKMMHYSLAGGIPAYWLHFSPSKDFAGNLRDSLLRKGEVLYDEAEFLLREELREPRYYFSLLQAIAQGKRKLSEIVNATGIPHATANKYLLVLSDLDIVEREVPITEEKPAKSKKGLYRIKDEFFAFWFRFVFPRRGDLEMGQLQRVAGEIHKGLPQHLSQVYERISAEILWDHANRFFPFDALGRWWDRGEEIDLVAFNREQGKLLCAEVKWSEKLVGTDIYEGLKAKAAKVPVRAAEAPEDTGKDGRTGRESQKAGPEKHFALFSKKGFTPAMLKTAREEGVTLFKADKPFFP